MNITEASKDILIAVLNSKIEKLKAEVKIYKYDHLTGLKTRYDFNERLDVMWSDFKLSDHNFMVAMVDINGLHNINRTKGIKAGDDLISSTAHQLCKLFKRDNVFRISGDEFFILKKCKDIEKFNKKLKKLKNISYGSISVSGNTCCKRK